ncbi:MAG: hypothetical protein ACK4JC_05395 [Silanimonas lenta]
MNESSEFTILEMTSKDNAPGARGRQVRQALLSLKIRAAFLYRGRKPKKTGPATGAGPGLPCGGIHGVRR